MTPELPEPLTPPNCDLRGYGYMPTFGQKLYGSQFYSLALRNPRAGLAGQKLWWESWTQCPAASLPDDDRDLARLADFGSDLKAWRAVKTIALHGFIRCSDGRLYHPFLAGEAIKSFDLRLRSDKRREADRERLRVWRDAQKVSNSAANALPPSDTKTEAETPDETRFETRPETASETPDDTRYKMREEKRIEKNRKEEVSSLADSSGTPPARDPEPPPEPIGDRLQFEGVAIWAKLTGDRLPLAESFVRGLLQDAPRGSGPKLMALLRQAEISPPPDPRTTLGSWLRSRIMPPPPDCPALRNKLPASKMPRLSDPPHLWADLSDGKWEVDQNGTKRPCFAGLYVDLTMQMLAEAAGISDPSWRGDYDVALRWLRDGFDFAGHILPVVKTVSARSRDKQISRLKYFDAAVREQRAT